jgi:branched-subunit amino acid ABC-type transport system permease component
VYDRECNIAEGRFYMFAGVVAWLQVLVILTLVISILVLVVLIAILALFFWYIKQQNKQSPIYLQVTKLALSLSTHLHRLGFSSIFNRKVLKRTYGYFPSNSPKHTDARIHVIRPSFHFRERFVKLPTHEPYERNAVGG